MDTKLTIEKAFEILESQVAGIPWEAIAFLYEHPADPLIEERIVFALKNAYTEAFFINDEVLHPSLWYAIVAENHLSESLMAPVIRLFTETEEDWDFMNEQGHFLVGKLAQKYGDQFVDKVMDAIELSAKNSLATPDLYLHEAFHFGTFSKYKERIFQLLKSDYRWKDSIVMILADINDPSAIPVLEEQLEIIKAEDRSDGVSSHSIIELEAAIKILKGESDFKPQKPFVETRSDWKTYLKAFERHFDPEPEPILPMASLRSNEMEPKIKKRKTGRNEPCPCGSGKKYKKCCLKLGTYE